MATLIIRNRIWPEFAGSGMTMKKFKLGGNIHTSTPSGYKKILIWGVDYINKLLGWTQNFQKICAEFHIKYTYSGKARKRSQHNPVTTHE